MLFILFQKIASVRKAVTHGMKINQRQNVINRKTMTSKPLLHKATVFIVMYSIKYM